jgi:hypothetical protein
MRSLTTAENRQLLDADYEQVLGFSQPAISVRGGITVNF